MRLFLIVQHTKAVSQHRPTMMQRLPSTGVSQKSLVHTVQGTAGSGVNRLPPDGGHSCHLAVSRRSGGSGGARARAGGGARGAVRGVVGAPRVARAQSSWPPGA